MPIPVSVISKCIRFFLCAAVTVTLQHVLTFSNPCTIAFSTNGCKISFGIFSCFTASSTVTSYCRRLEKRICWICRYRETSSVSCPTVTSRFPWLNTRRKSCESARILSAISSLSCSIACQYKESRVLYKKCGLICACRAASSLSFSCSVIT